MSTRVFDWIVVGAGGAGCAATYFLNRDGRSTLTIDRYRLNHAFGSSHGRTRILRTAYSEGPHYVPLVLRSRLLWRRLAKEVGREIFRPTGVVLVGRRNSSRIRGALKSARLHGLPHEILSPEAIQARFPAFRPRPEEVAVWDPGGGVLFPERALTSFVRRAAANGARFVWNAPVTDWEVGPDGLVRVTARGSEFRARGLILTTGAWLPSLLPELRLPLEIEQQTVFWFRYDAARRTAFQNMPAFVWQREGEGYFYGIPDMGDGVKVAADVGNRSVTSITVRNGPALRSCRGSGASQESTFPAYRRGPGNGSPVSTRILPTTISSSMCTPITRTSSWPRPVPVTGSSS